MLDSPTPSTISLAIVCTNAWYACIVAVFDRVSNPSGILAVERYPVSVLRTQSPTSQ
jgi:hypothetical protein